MESLQRRGFRTVSGLVRLPSFILRPENLFHKIGESFGYRDIDFDSHPVFSKQYLLRAADEQACRGLFTKGILDHYDQRAGLSTEGDGDSLLFYRASKRVPLKECRLSWRTGMVSSGFSRLMSRYKRHQSISGTERRDI